MYGILGEYECEHGMFKNTMCFSSSYIDLNFVFVFLRIQKKGGQFKIKKKKKLFAYLQWV